MTYTQKTWATGNTITDDALNNMEQGLAEVAAAIAERGEDMTYTRKTWATGDTITADSLNNMEQGIADATDAITALEDSGSMDDTVVSYNQMNETVEAYLAAADAAYTDDNYASVSVVSDYTSEDNHDDPAGYELSIETDGSICFMDADEPARSWAETVTSGTYDVYDLIPGHSYLWYVTASDNTVPQAGRLNATGLVRQIYASVGDNCRDMGGWDCDGGTVRYGILYRGAGVSSIGTTLKNKLHVRSEVDLQENDDNPLFGDTVKYYRFGLYTPTSYEDLFELSDDNEYLLVLRKCLQQIMYNAAYGIPTYYHCSLGADRTGLVSFFLLGLLGVSPADCDKNYELTALGGSAFWGSTNLTTRKRTYAPWRGLRSYFSSLVEDGSLVDNIVYWCARAGISAAEINLYRSAMSTGTPGTISFENTISNTLTMISSDNDAESITSGASYSALLTVDNGAIFESITIYMGGEDVTSDVWVADTMTIEIPEVTGDIIITATANANLASITYNLTNCTASSDVTSVTKGDSLAITLEADVYYTISSVSVTMDGAAVDAYSNGTVNIAEVTGNIVITAVAVCNFTNQIPISTDTDGSIYNGVGYAEKTRINSTGATEAYGGFYATGFIPVSVGDVIRLENVQFRYGASTAGNQRLTLYDSDHAFVVQINANVSSSTYFSGFTRNSDGDLTQVTIASGDTVAYMRMCAQYIGDDSIITVNEEIA